MKTTISYRVEWNLMTRCKWEYVCHAETLRKAKSTASAIKKSWTKGFCKVRIIKITTTEQIVRFKPTTKRN